MDELPIDEEFAALIPPITTEEYEKLEQSILAKGCRDKLVVWGENSTILDGHNRYAICRKHGIPYLTVPRSFETREQAKVWIIGNQLGRRNLSPFDRASLALQLKDIFAEKAKEKEKTHTKEGYQKSENPPIHTNEEMAKLAQVSPDTMHKVKVIQEEGTPEQKRQAKNKEKTINQVHKEIRPPKTDKKKEPKKNKPEEKMGEEFRRALSELAMAIKNEKDHKWKTTDKAVAIRKIKDLLSIITR